MWPRAWCTRSAGRLARGPTSTRRQRCCTAGKRRSLPMPAIPERTSGRNLPSATSHGTSRSNAALSKLPKGLRDVAEPVERALSQVRAWVEHPFHIIKNLFRHRKLRYRGLAKNTAQLHTLFALANLVIVKKTLLAQGRT